MNIRPSIFLLFVFFFSELVIASSFEGTLYLRGSRDPIGNATIYILPHKIKITSDDQGRFETPEIPSGEFQWVINLSGFERFEKSDQSIESSGNSPKEVRKFYLDKNIETVYETTIVSKENTDGALRKISVKKAAQLPGAGLDPVKAVQNVPGVNRTPGFGSQVIIQGSAPQDTKYSIDGHEIPLIFHFGGLSSVLMPELTSTIDYLSAGYQVPYGRAMGGVINLNSADLESSHFKGMAFADIFNLGAAIETPIGTNQSLAVGGRASYVGSVLKAVAKNNKNFNLTVAPNFNDLGFIYRNKINSNLEFKMITLGSMDSLQFVIDEPINSDPLLRGGFSNQTAFFRTIPQLKWTHSKDSITQASLGLGRDFIDTQIGDQYFVLKSTVVSLRIDQENKHSPLWKTNIGTDSSSRWSDIQFQLPLFLSQGGVIDPLSTTESRTADLKGIQSHLVGLYWNNQLKTREDSAFTFYPGVRMDYFSEIKDLTFSPRLAARYQHTPTLALVSAGGLYTQPPLAQFSSPSYGNPNLKHSNAYHFTVKAEKDLAQELSKGSELNSGVFIRWFDHLVLPDTSTIYANTGSGRAIGWENSFNYSFDPWTFYAAYTLSRSTRWDPSHTEYLYQYDQTHFLTLIAAVNLPRNWRISTRARYVTGTLTSLPVGSSLDTDNDVYIPLSGDLYNNRLSPFIMVDLRADKKWVYDTWTLSLYIDIQNALNRKNPEGLQFSYDYGVRKETSGIPILPTIGLKGEF